MLRKLYPIFVFPLCLYINSQEALLSKTNNNIEEILRENETQIFLNYSEIKNITIKNNQELKALESLVNSTSFTLSSKIAKRYPSLDLQASGLPKYVSGKNYSSSSSTTKTSQFSANPSLNIKLDLIDPLRGSEIKIARNNYAIATNNYEIKKKDLIKDAKSEDYSYNNLENILKTNISKAYLNLKLNEEKILSSLKEISSTEESLRLARLRYDVGISTLKDVLVRQKELSNANSKNIDAIYNYNLNLDELERLTFLKISNICNEGENLFKNEIESICNI